MRQELQAQQVSLELMELWVRLVQLDRPVTQVLLAEQASLVIQDVQEELELLELLVQLVAREVRVQ